MKETLSLYFAFLKESSLEVKNNLSIYGIYILGLMAVILVSHYIEQTYTKGSLEIQIIGKILFSIMPILIVSKLLYVIKIRTSGMGNYQSVMTNFLIYNILYIGLILSALLICSISGFILYYLFKSHLMLWAIGFLILPFIYFLIFYSLAPFIAVFEENRAVSFFKKSRVLTKKNILMVLLNHLFAWLPGLLYIAYNFYNVTPETRNILVLSTAGPEAFFQLVTTMATVKIYFYLLNYDASYE